MKFNNGFDINELLSDEKYRARLILAGYAIVFIVIIILIRTSNTGYKNNSSNTNSNNTNTTTNTETVNTNSETSSEYGEMIHTQSDESNTDSLYNRFSFLRLNNYHFNYVFDFGDKLAIDGEKYDEKIRFSVTNTQNDNTVEYFANSDTLKVKLDGKYESAEYPTIYIDCFDNVKLYTILKMSKLNSTEDNVLIYTISNKLLSEVVMSSYSLTVNRDEDRFNEIRVTLENNKITAIDLDLTNLLGQNSDLKKLLISLKYDKFAQIGDFTIDF